MPGAATAEKLEQPKSLENIGLELLRQYQDSQVDKAANLAIKILVPGAVAVGVVATALHLIANPPDAPIYQSKEFRSIGNYAGATTLLAMISVGVSKGVAYVLNRSRNSNNDEDDVRYAPIHSDISAHFDEFGGFTQGSSGMNEEDHVDDVLSDTVAQDAFRLLSPDHKDAVLLDMLHYRLSMGETDSIDTFRNYIEHRNQGAVDLLVQKVIDGCQDDQLPQYHDLLQGKQVTRAIDHYLSTNDTQSAWRIVGCNMPITNNKLVYVVEIIDQFIEQGSYDGAYNI